MRPVQTVLGPLPASCVRGPVLAHEHLVLDLRRENDRDAVLLPGTRAAPVAAELARLRKEYGLALVIELTCPGMGRDPHALTRISRASGVAVVAATGWYHQFFHPPEVAAADTDLLSSTASPIPVSAPASSARSAATRPGPARPNDAC